MAEYIRQTGIAPVCTNNEARTYFSGRGLTYDDITEGDILTLVMLLNKHIKLANKTCETSMGTMYLSRRVDMKRKTNGAIVSCFLYVNSHYFERRECISFNKGGWIGAKYVIEGEVVHTCLDHFIAVCGSFYLTRDTMKLWLKLQTKSQRGQH